VNRLDQGLAVIQQGEERKAMIGLGNPVQEAVFRAENGSGLDNNLFFKIEDKG
jgi:hypothetical protein